MANARFGVVVLSPAFFSKGWTRRELRGLVAREIDGGKIILPIWHGVSRNDVASFSPPLADIMAINTENKDVKSAALDLLEVVRPELFQSVRNDLPNLVDARSPFDWSTACSYRIPIESLRNMSVMRLSSVINFWTCVLGKLPPGAESLKEEPGSLSCLLDAHALFSGIVQPFTKSKTDRQIVIYILKPKWTIHFAGGQFSKAPAPENAVLAVYASLDEPESSSRILGQIESWEFVATNDGSTLPRDSEDRFKRRKW